MYLSAEFRRLICTFNFVIFMKQSRSFLFGIFRFEKLYRILGGGNGKKTASYVSVD